MWSQTMLWCRLWWSSIPFNIQWCMARGILFWKWITIHWLILFLFLFWTTISLVSSCAYIFFPVEPYHVCQRLQLHAFWVSHCPAIGLYRLSWGRCEVDLLFCMRVSLSPSSRMPSNSSVHSKPKFCYIGVCLHTAPSLYIWFDYKGYRTRWKVWGFLTRAPMPTLGQDQPTPPHPLSHLNLKPFISFCSTMQSWKHFALLFLCVNMWMIICYKNVKYV